MREKGVNHLVPGPDYMVDAINFATKQPEFLARHYRCQSLASNGPVVDSRYLNLVFGSTETTHNKLFLSSLHSRTFLDDSPGLDTV
ncbi:hypothetical protein TNCV_2259591 [Trichonephila clavipes]|nr:hypothetical protein TNCV_2259591 [Trichonephila clavipes]